MSGHVEVSGLTRALDELTGAVEALRDDVRDGLDRIGDACALLALTAAYEPFTDHTNTAATRQAIEALIARVAHNSK